MNDIKDGGSAFPSTQYANGISPSGHSVGMTLRDYFAVKATEKDIKKAMKLVDRDVVWGLPPNARQIARYICADAMLKAREK